MIIFESSLPGSISSQRSNFVTNVVSFIINGVLPEQKPELIDVEELQVINNLEQVITEGATFTIPIGVTRRFSVSVLPSDASNQNVTWQSDDSAALRVTSGGYLEARALKNHVKITVKAVDANISKYFYIDVVEKSAPFEFTAELERTTLEIGQSTQLRVILSDRERREFDPYLLEFTSSNLDVATINNFGVVNAVSEGSATLTISNHPTSYQIVVTTNSLPVIKPTSLHLSGASTGYVYGYTQLNVAFDDENISDQSVTYVSSNEAIATVDENGLVFGAKVSGKVIIRCYANADFNVYDELEIEMLDVLPSSLSLSVNSTSFSVGKKMTIVPTLSHDLPLEIPVTNQEIRYQSSDFTIAEVASLNGQGIVLGKKSGTVIITATSLANEEASAVITLTITPLEVINEGNITEFGAYLRKAVGHFSLFFVNGIFGALTFYFFLDKKNVLTRLLLAIIPGVFVAGLSEFIQFFVDGRGATIFDVLIDSSGYLVAVLIVYLFFIIKTKIKTKKIDKIE